MDFLGPLSRDDELTGTMGLIEQLGYDLPAADVLAAANVSIAKTDKGLLRFTVQDLARDDDYQRLVHETITRSPATGGCVLQASITQPLPVHHVVSLLACSAHWCAATCSASGPSEAV